MAFPIQIKKSLPLVPDKTLFARREQLKDYINKDGTYLPKSVLHADLDRGMLDFVKTDLQLVTSGKIVPMIDTIITTQNWAQFAETWTFVDQDFNPQVPFISVVRQPEVKYGTNPSLRWNIPNRKEFYYASVPTWNGNQEGMDIYKIPQPVPVDITYNVRIVCNRMRELNQFNKIILQKFSSRQAYTFIKGQYVPIVMQSLSDESITDLEKRKYYVQNYEFIMLGYLIDEDEFEVKPAISRILQVMEVEGYTPVGKKNQTYPKNPDLFTQEFLFVTGNTVLSDIMDYMVNMTVDSTENVTSYDVYINNQYYGTDVNEILINTNDVLRVEVVKTDNSLESKILFTNKLL
jgi:hypothetical protein